MSTKKSTAREMFGAYFPRVVVEPSARNAVRSSRPLPRRPRLSENDLFLGAIGDDMNRRSILRHSLAVAASLAVAKSTVLRPDVKPDAIQ